MDTLASRYVALWNEPDPGLRRKTIEELWAADGAHLLEPPEAARAEASRLGFAGSTGRFQHLRGGPGRGPGLCWRGAVPTYRR